MERRSLDEPPGAVGELGRPEDLTVFSDACPQLGVDNVWVAAHLDGDELARWRQAGCRPLGKQTLDELEGIAATEGTDDAMIWLARLQHRPMAASPSDEAGDAGQDAQRLFLCPIVSCEQETVYICSDGEIDRMGWRKITLSPDPNRS